MRRGGFRRPLVPAMSGSHSGRNPGIFGPLGVFAPPSKDSTEEGAPDCRRAARSRNDGRGCALLDVFEVGNRSQQFAAIAEQDAELLIRQIRHCIGEAITAVKTTKERLWEADIYRTAGDIALMSPESDAANAEQYFDRTLSGNCARRWPWRGCGSG